jgi:hypothetical protein
VSERKSPGELTATVGEHVHRGRRQPHTPSIRERLENAGITVESDRENKGFAQKQRESGDKKSDGTNSRPTLKGKIMSENQQQTTVGDVGKATGASMYEAINRGGSIHISAKSPMLEYGEFAGKVVFTAAVTLGVAWGVKRIWNAGRGDEFGGE